MNTQWKRTISKFGLTFILLAALLLTGCQTIGLSAVEDPPVEPPVEETEEPVTLPEPLTEEETLAIFEEVEPLWEDAEYDPADYTDWVEIECDTSTGEGCLLPNGCDLSTGEGCALDDGCNFVTLEGCILPNGCNLETGEGCDLLFDGCNPVTFEGCPVLEGCDLETGDGCDIMGCNIVTGEGCGLPDGCNPITMEGCAFSNGDGTDIWDEFDGMWEMANQEWKDADANGQWQEGYYSGLELLGGDGGWENVTEEDIANFFD